MTTHNVDLMTSARECLKGRWNLLIKATSIYLLIEFCSIFITWNIDLIIPITKSTSICGNFVNRIFSIGNFLTLLMISGPMMIGFSYFSLTISRQEETRLSQLFFGFKIFSKSVTLKFLINFLIFLWSLLLIIPGIIAELSYAMAPLIIIEDNTISPMEAIRKSKKMMDGYKVKLFELWLRFSLWFIFSILTFGIGFFWTIPYWYVSLWKFYEDIKDNKIDVVL